jgi:hypothetical protein
MALHMDKHSRLISANGIPQLWTTAGPYRKRHVLNSVYDNFEYSTSDSPNITSVLAPPISENRMAFETSSNDGYFVYDNEFIYSMCWYFYRNKNATLLKQFVNLIFIEYALKKVYIQVKSQMGSDTGTWGNKAAAVITLGGKKYRLTGFGMSVNNIALAIQTQLSGDKSLTIEVSGNAITIDLGARDPDFEVGLTVENASGQESLTLNPYYGSSQDPGRSYAYTQRFFKKEGATGQLLNIMPMITASQELEEEEDLPPLSFTVKEGEEEPPDLLLAFVSVEEEDGLMEFDIIPLRTLLGIIDEEYNQNDTLYSSNRVYGDVKVTHQVFNIPILPKADTWPGFGFLADTAKDIQYPLDWVNFLHNQDHFFNDHTEPPILERHFYDRHYSCSDILFGICFQIYSYTHKYNNPLGQHGSIGTSVIGSGFITNFYIRFEGGQLTLTESNENDATIVITETFSVYDGTYLPDDQRVSLSKCQQEGVTWGSNLLIKDTVQTGPHLSIPTKNDVDYSAADHSFFAGRIVYKHDEEYVYSWLRQFEMLQNVETITTYENCAWGYNPIEWLEYELQLKYDNEIITTISTMNPPTIPPFINSTEIIQDSDDCPKYRYINCQRSTGVLIDYEETFEPFKIPPSEYTTSNITQTTIETIKGFPLYYRTGDLPVVYGDITAVFDCEQPGSICYVQIKPWKENSYVLRWDANSYLNQAQTTPQALGSAFLEKTTTVNDRYVQMYIEDNYDITNVKVPLDTYTLYSTKRKSPLKNKRTP